MYLELGRGLDVVRVRSGDSPEIQRGGWRLGELV